MEDLTKTQTVLLCLLVSFVTSIGTGIITASLLQEAPQNFTQTINRVVERTVETIVPQPTGTVTREVTVVVKEEDLIIDSINKNHNSLVRIFQNQNIGSPAFQTIGVIVKKDGAILADKRFIASNKNYSATFIDGKTFPVKIAGTGQNTNAIFLTPVIPTGVSEIFVPASVGNSDNIQLGQTVIALGGKEKEAVAIGRTVSVNQVDIQSQGTTTKSVATFETDTPLRDGVPGSVVLNLNGDAVGFENFDQSSLRETVYTALNVIRRENPSFFEPVTN